MSKQGDRRRRVGVLVQDAVDRQEWEAISAAVEVMHEHGTGLCCLVGAQWWFPEHGGVDPTLFDGVIVVDHVGNGEVMSVARRLHERLPELPMVALASPWSGLPMPVVWSDAAAGVRQAVEHVAVEHGRRRVAFVWARESSVEAAQCHQAYREALDAAGLAYEPSLVVWGGEDRAAGEAAVGVLWDERQLAVDAVVAVSDDVALGVMEALRARGLRVPEDVAVVGFGDAMPGRYEMPPLTTVQTAVYRQGRVAAEMLWRLMQGETVKSEAVSARLVVRRSCGCMPDVTRWAAMASALKAPDGGAGEGGAVEALRPLCVDLSVPSCAERLWAVFVEAVEGPEKAVERFLRFFEALLVEASRVRGRASLGEQLWMTLRRSAVAYLSDRRVLLRAGDVLQQAYVLIGDVRRRVVALRHLEASRREEWYYRLHQTMAKVRRLEEMVAGLSEYFSQAGVARGYLALEEGSGGEVRLLLAYEAGRRKTHLEGRVFSTQQLLLAEISLLSESIALVVLPITSEWRRFGFVALAWSAQDFWIYTQLPQLLGGVIARLTLAMQEEHARQLAEEARRRAEEALDRLVSVRAITDRMRGTADAEGVLRVMLESLGQRLGASKAAIRLGTREQLVQVSRSTEQEG